MIKLIFNTNDAYFAYECARCHLNLLEIIFVPCICFFFVDFYSSPRPRITVFRAPWISRTRLASCTPYSRRDDLPTAYRIYRPISRTILVLFLPLVSLGLVSIPFFYSPSIDEESDGTNWKLFIQILTHGICVSFRDHFLLRTL